MLDRKDFIKIGDNVRDNYRTHIFTKGLDVPVVLNCDIF